MATRYPNALLTAVALIINWLVANGHRVLFSEALMVTSH